MSKDTKISWCDSSINPMMGCDGCELRTREESHCYAAAHCARYAGTKGYPKSFDRPTLFTERFHVAARWSDLTGKERPSKPWLNGYPRIIFCCDLGDPWTESLPIDWIASYLPMIADTPHIWIFCTKRPSRAKQCFQWHEAPKNLWLLTTVTSDGNLRRVAELVRTPGISVRGVSLEPLLGPIDLTRVNYTAQLRETLVKFARWAAKEDGEDPEEAARKAASSVSDEGLPEDEKPRLNVLSGEWFDGWDSGSRGEKLNWVIAGGESGPGARPPHPDWFRAIRDQCQESGVPYFHKQNGEWEVFYDRDKDDPDWRKCPGCDEPNERYLNLAGGHGFHGERVVAVRRVGKESAGRLLDGREWLQMPEVRR